MAQSIFLIKNDPTRRIPLALATGLELLFVWILWQALLALLWLSSAIMTVDIVASTMPSPRFVTDEHMQLIVWAETCIIGYLITIAAKLWDSAIDWLYFLRRAIR